MGGKGKGGGWGSCDPTAPRPASHILTCELAKRELTPASQPRRACAFFARACAKNVGPPEERGVRPRGRAMSADELQGEGRRPAEGRGDGQEAWLCACQLPVYLCSHRSSRARAVWQVVLHADQTKGGSGEPPKTFTFDQVYDDTSQQEVTRPHIPTAHEAASARRGCRTRPTRCK